MEKFFWKNKWVFILAAIWSAAWLGNLWRFPYMVYDYGWWSFIIAYLVILFLMWLWLLIWEIALWQYTQKGAPDAFWSVNSYLKWLWWAWIFTAAVILTYYVVVIWWSIDYLVYSINSFINSQSLPWSNNAKEFFFNNVLHITDSISSLWSIAWPVFWWTLISWVLIYFFTFKSTKSVWKVVLVTATLPFLTLLILAIRWFTLPGADLWLKYLITIDVEKLYDFKTWVAAAWQIFFTLSLSMGIMIAYWALKKRDTEIVQSTIIVAIGNTIISFLAAIAVFGTLGYMAFKSGVSITEVFAWWPSLAFVTFPEAIVKLPALQSLFAILFFVTLFMLAIDSAMSLIEAVSVALREKFKNLSIEVLTLIVVSILGLWSLLYVFGNWLYILDIVDHFVNSYSMLFIGFVSAIVFVYWWQKLGNFIDERNSCLFKFIFNKWYFLISWVISILILWYLLFKNIKDLVVGWLKYGWYPEGYLWIFGVFVLVGIYLISIVLNIIELKLKKDKSLVEKIKSKIE